METHEIPDELLTQPEIRMTGTLLTQKPHRLSFQFTACFVLFIIAFTQLYWINFLDLATLLPAVKSKIFSEHQWWRVFTAMFIHADLGHLVSNLYMLSIFLYFIFGYFGLKSSLLLSLAGGAVVNLISITTYAPNIRLLGASGLVYLLGGFWLTIYFLIQRQHGILSRVLRVIGISLMVFVPSTLEPTTSYRTHFIGFVIGLIAGLFFHYLNRTEIRKHEKYALID